MTATRRRKARVLIVCDGKLWYIRHVAYTVVEGETGMIVYHCDKSMGRSGGYESLGDIPMVRRACVALNRARAAARKDGSGS